MAKLIVLFVAAFAVVGVYGHGRFMKPASRSSVWRVSEFQSQNPPANYDDNALRCGGVNQVDDPGSNCGVCGDGLSESQPRPNEYNGRFYRGIITGRYTAGQVIDVEVDLTAYHQGHHEFRLCTNPQSTSQSCFNQHVLQLADGSGTKLKAKGLGVHRAQVRLPAGVRCNHCVIQWNYRVGNSWGNCDDGSSGMGCGPQETFRGCSDVSIS